MAFTFGVEDPLESSRAAIIRALEVATGHKVYEGEAPDEVDEDAAGYIRPYIILFSGDGDTLPETDLSGRLDLGGLRWDFQTTTVAATPGICSQVGGKVRRTLTNFPLGTYHVLPSPSGFENRIPIRDTTINPVRYFLPRMWRLDTT